MSPDSPLLEGSTLPEVNFQRGTLWQKTVDRTRHALKSGALIPIATDYEIVEDHTVPFIVRVVLNLQRKDADRQQQSAKEAEGKPANPFLPYDPDLFVTDISSTHLCLLNKFNVVNHHLLLITRNFESQESLLTLADFAALARCLDEFDNLAFYNSGAASGASQPHKHLQLIPLPMTPEGPSLPIAAQIEMLSTQAEITKLPAFPFAHGCVRFELGDGHRPTALAQTLLDTYYRLLSALGLSQTAIPDRPPTSAYNLLATREWMLMVPRSQLAYGDISANSLGFAGTILVRSAEQLEQVKAIGPIATLQRLTYP